MLFTDISEFKRNIKLELSEQKKKERINLCFKTGEVFKQVTVFEEIVRTDKKKKFKKYGAWFISEKNAVFLSKEEIRDFLEKEEALLQNNIKQEKCVSH